jgi:VWFA-related protein
MNSPCLAWMSIFVSAFPAFAHQGVIPSVPAPTAPAKVDSRITLAVIANDKSGKPVGGLQQQDFTILDNKQPQKILSFEAVRGRTSGDAGVTIVLVIDAVNTSFIRMGFVRGQIDKFLRQDGGRLAWPVSLAILTDSGLDMQQGASLDGNTLAVYLDQRETGLRSLHRSQGFYGAAERFQLSLRALRQLAEYEGGRPGRKLMIWISPGWPLLSGPRMELSFKDEQNAFNTVVALSTQLRHSRVTLYNVNPLGAAESVGRVFYYEQFLKGVTAPNKVQLGDLALQVVASHSGGRVLNSNSDIAGEIARCARDANAYYVLSFDSLPADGPNDYNAIQVKIAQPQLKAQTLSGYYAQPLHTRIP